MTTVDDDPEFAALIQLSEELGRDPLRTQAAGGNTSLKRDGILWIKASGTWLAEAGEHNTMVRVALEPLLAALAAGDERAGTATAFVIDDPSSHGLRASVETPVHAVISAPVVVHIHCVATIAVSVRPDAEVLVAERLAAVSGVRFAFIPYVHPGVPLAHALADRDESANVFVLGNHGLIVAAGTVPEAADLVRRVSAALDAPRRTKGPPDVLGLAQLADGSSYRLPHDLLAHDVATDAASLAIAVRGTLYPDHVVFLGPGIAILEPGELPAEVARRSASVGHAPPPMLAIPGRGVLLHRDVLRGADELSRALAEVTARIPPGVEVNCLTADQEAALVDWEAETYRLSLARTREAMPR